MENMAKARRQSRRKGCRRNRSNALRGGAGEAYTLGGPVAGAPIINNQGQEIVRFPSCEEAVRPGYISGSASEIRGGLPGFAGGRRLAKRKTYRKTRRGRKAKRGGGEGSPYPQTYASETTTYQPPANGASFTPQPVPGATNVTTTIRGGSLSGFRGGVLETAADQQLGGRRGNRKLKGGRQTNEFNVVGNGIGLMESSQSGCGTGLEAINNPLNKGDLASLITAPPPLVPVPTPGSGDALQKGGAPVINPAPAAAGYDPGAMMVQEAPRSGWTTWPSNAQGGDAGTLSDGRTPFLINVPFSAQPTPSPACLKTGGGKKKSRKHAKKSKKSRKSSRKTHKGRKSNRKGNRK